MSNATFNKNMKKCFRIHYSIAGKGYLVVEAESPEEAERLFTTRPLDSWDVTEQTANYDIVEITEDQEKYRQ